MLTNLGLLINAMLISTPPLLLAALGSCFSERSGVVNIGIEGMMTLGAFVGAAVAYFTGNGWIGFFAGGLAGAVLGLIHAVVCVSLHADQTIAGTAINFIGPGFAIFLCKAIFENSSDSPALDMMAKLPKMFTNDKGVSIFPAGSFQYNVISTYSVAYLSFLVVALIWFVFYKTRFGMRLRAAGEHPEACETLGINVYAVRYVCVMPSSPSRPYRSSVLRSSSARASSRSQPSSSVSSPRAAPSSAASSSDSVTVSSHCSAARTSSARTSSA